MARTILSLNQYAPMFITPAIISAIAAPFCPPTAEPINMNRTDSTAKKKVVFNVLIFTYSSLRLINIQVYYYKHPVWQSQIPFKIPLKLHPSQPYVLLHTLLLPYAFYPLPESP